jgi:hypothetical protein
MIGFIDGFFTVTLNYNQFFFIWFVRLFSLRPLLAYCASLRWWWRWLWKSRSNVDRLGKPKFSEKTCPSTTFVHHKIPHDLTRTVAVRNPRLFFFIIFIIWFVRLLALRPLLAYCASLGWWWRWFWKSRSNVDRQGKPKFSEKTCPSATFIHHKIPHDLTRFEPGPSRWGLSYGAANYNQVQRLTINRRPNPFYLSAEGSLHSCPCLRLLIYERTTYIISRRIYSPENTSVNVEKCLLGAA